MTSPGSRDPAGDKPNPFARAERPADPRNPAADRQQQLIADHPFAEDVDQLAFGEASLPQIVLQQRRIEIAVIVEKAGIGGDRLGDGDVG